LWADLRDSRPNGVETPQKLGLTSFEFSLGLASVTFSYGVGGVLGAQLFLGPGPFISTNAAASCTIDFSHWGKSRLGITTQVAGMAGMGFAADVAAQKSFGIDWSDSGNESGSPNPSESQSMVNHDTDYTFHVEGGIPVPETIVAVGAIDVSTRGVTAARSGEGPGVSLYGAAGVARNDSWSVSVQSVVRWVKEHL
jgi:hypothetical protein